MAKVYYGIGSNPTTQITPAPLIVVSYQPYYADENMIGYDYRLTLTGYATAPLEGEQNSTNVITAVETLMHTIFDKNGSTLLVTTDDGDPLLRATGSKIEAISIDGNNNLWTNYADYTIDITFNEVSFIGCDSNTISCPNIIVQNYPSSLVDISAHKIKSFKDDWSFSIGEEQYQAVGGAISNQFFNVKYSIQAEGIHHFKGVNYDKLIPAWEQAKNFCQDRLYDQVSRLIANVNERKTDTDDMCQPNTSSSPPLLFDNYDINKGNFGLIYDYQIYNEKITTSASEANGTFSLEYTALVKRYNTDNAYSNMPQNKHVMHTVSTSKTVSDSRSNRNIQLNINGRIEGLIPGGLIKNGGSQLQLQSNGVLLVSANNTETKYDYAKDYYNEIITNNRDFTYAFKEYFGINYALFESSCSESSVGPVPSTFNVNHSYSDGAIEYTASFDGNRVCAGNDSYYTDVNFTLEDKIEATAEIIIPGRVQGPLIQRLNAYNPRTVSVSINGYANKDCCWDFSSYADSVCNGALGLDSILPNANIPNAILTEDSNNINPLDGSFSVTRKYTYYDI